MIAPPSVGEYMARHTPQSTLKMMKATGHCPHMSAPEETIACMKDYLRSRHHFRSQELVTHH
jgi:sigma-B regulation protein RsbQ